MPLEEKEIINKLKSTYAAVQKKVNSIEVESSKQKRTNTINDMLAQDILTHIFCFLDSKDLVNVALTCVLWNKILQQRNLLWQSFIIRDYQIDPQNNDLREVGRKEYLDLDAHNKRQQKKKILQEEITDQQSVLDKQSKMAQEATAIGMGGILGGSYYEQKRTERVITNNQAHIEQIDKEVTPLLLSKSMTR